MPSLSSQANYSVVSVSVVSFSLLSYKYPAPLPIGYTRKTGESQEIDKNQGEE
jgi:hypothetical protein